MIAALLLHSFLGACGHFCSCEAAAKECRPETPVDRVHDARLNAQFASFSGGECSGRPDPCCCPENCVCNTEIFLKLDFGHGHSDHQDGSCSRCDVGPKDTPFVSGLSLVLEHVPFPALLSPLLDQDELFDFTRLKMQVGVALPPRLRLHLFLERFLI